MAFGVKIRPDQTVTWFYIKLNKKNFKSLVLETTKPLDVFVKHYLGDLYQV